MLISALCKVKKSVKISTLRADIIPMENKFQMISDKIRELLKNSPIEDIENNINALIKNKCTELGLVSREEFDVQTEVLRKTREKLEAVEQELAKCETKTK
jgi:BMFP domain-containing protein YqiC